MNDDYYYSNYYRLNLFCSSLCIGNEALEVFAEYNQQDATSHNLYTSVRRSACVRRFFRPSSGAHNYTYSVIYLSDQYCYLLLCWPS